MKKEKLQPPTSTYLRKDILSPHVSIQRLHGNLQVKGTRDTNGAADTIESNGLDVFKGDVEGWLVDKHEGLGKEEREEGRDGELEGEDLACGWRFICTGPGGKEGGKEGGTHLVQRVQQSLAGLQGALDPAHVPRRFKPLGVVDFLPGQDLESLGHQVVHGSRHGLLEPVLVLLLELFLGHVDSHLADAVVRLGR